jgi:hypothetical protein
MTCTEITLQKVHIPGPRSSNIRVHLIAISATSKLVLVLRHVRPRTLAQGIVAPIVVVVIIVLRYTITASRGPMPSHDPLQLDLERVDVVLRNVIALAGKSKTISHDRNAEFKRSENGLGSVTLCSHRGLASSGNRALDGGGKDLRPPGEKVRKDRRSVKRGQLEDQRTKRHRARDSGRRSRRKCSTSCKRRRDRGRSRDSTPRRRRDDETSPRTNRDLDCEARGRGLALRSLRGLGSARWPYQNQFS